VCVSLEDAVLWDLGKSDTFGSVMSLVPALLVGDIEGITCCYSFFLSRVHWGGIFAHPVFIPPPLWHIAAQQGNNGYSWILHHSFSSEDFTIFSVRQLYPREWKWPPRKDADTYSRIARFEREFEKMTKSIHSI